MIISQWLFELNMLRGNILTPGQPNILKWITKITFPWSNKQGKACLNFQAYANQISFAIMTYEYKLN